MSIEARVELMIDREIIGSRYFKTDGYIGDWASQLVVSLYHTTPKSILNNRSLFRFMFNDYTENDYFLGDLCTIEVLEDSYYIQVFSSSKEPLNKKLLFKGSLDEFSRKFC